MPPAETADLELIQFRCLKLYSFNQTVDKYGSELSTLAAIFVYSLSAVCLWGIQQYFFVQIG